MKMKDGNAVRYFEERRKEAADETLKQINIARRKLGEATRAIEEGGNSYAVASHLNLAEIHTSIAMLENRKGADIRVK